MKIKFKSSLSSQVLMAYGKFIIAPALFLLIEPIIGYFNGNRSAIDYVETYVKNQDSLYIALPMDRYERLNGSRKTRVKTVISSTFTKKRITMHSYIYFIDLYKRYLEIIWIEGIDNFVGHKGKHYDVAKIQQLQLEGGMVLCVYVNRIQWHDKSYGTKANPMPVFLHRFVSGDKIDERNKELMYIDSIYPNEDHLFYDYLSPRTVRRMRNTPDSINRKYVEYYLRYILPKDEFKRLFVK